MKRHRNNPLCVLLLAASCATLACPTLAAPKASPQRATEKAQAFFAKSLNNPTQLPMVLAGLRATGDATLLPLFAALCESSDKETRLIATASIAAVGGKDAAPALQTRLRKDPSMLIRAEALLQLDALDAITVGELIEASLLDDEGVQLLAARALSRRKKSDRVPALLQKLTASRDPDTASLARMTRLAQGDRTQIGPLRTTLLDAKTGDDLRIRLLDQIREEAIAAALPLAERLTKNDMPLVVRLRAYRAMASLSPQAQAQLLAAIEAPGRLALRVNLLRLLADQRNATAALVQLAKGRDVIGDLAQFELARPVGGAKAQAKLAAALAAGHPVILEYVLQRLREDLAKPTAPREFYAKPLLHAVRSATLREGPLTTRHDRIARTLELLGKLNTPTSNAGLAAILANRKKRVLIQLTCGALYRCDTAEASKLLTPFLQSPYADRKLCAALLLAKQKNPASLAPLRDLQETTSPRDTQTLTLVHWNLLKLAAQPADQNLATLLGE